MFPGRSPKHLPAPERIRLSPGQILHVPAFWFHHVISETPTLSLNVFSHSAVPSAAAAVLSEPLPLSPMWPASLLRPALAAMLDRLLQLGVLSGGFIHYLPIGTPMHLSISLSPSLSLSCYHLYRWIAGYIYIDR